MSDPDGEREKRLYPPGSDSPAAGGRTHTDSHSFAYACADPDAFAYPGADIRAHGCSDADIHARTDACAYRCADAYPGADARAYCHSHTVPDARTDACAYRHACADHILGEADGNKYPRPE